MAIRTPAVQVDVDPCERFVKEYDYARAPETQERIYDYGVREGCVLVVPAGAPFVDWATVGVSVLSLLLVVAVFSRRAVRTEIARVPAR